MQTQQFQFLLDKSAVTLSILCTLHCFLLPVVLVVFPSVFTSLLADELFHQLMIFVVIPVSVIALSLGCSKHKQYRLLMMGITGIAFLIAALFVGEALLGELGEKLLTLVGSVVIAFGHFLNYRLFKKVCNSCC